MSYSKLLSFLCLSFIFGIFVQSFIKIPSFFIWGFLFFVVIFIFIFLALNKNIYILGFFVLLFLLGVIRFQISEFSMANDRLLNIVDEKEVSIIGYISDEPDVRDTYQRIKLKVGDSKVLVTTNRYPEYKYLDEISVKGKLEIPAEGPEGYPSFSYKNYLMKDGIYTVMAFPKIEIVGKAKSTVYSFFYSKILGLKDKLRQSIDKNYPSPENLILKGLVLGDKTAIPTEIKNKFNITGTSHIIAVSGTHVVILCSILMAFLLFIGLYRQQAFYFSVIFILFYIVLVGLPASGIRAGIMGIIYLLGQKLGRQSTSSRIIVLAAAVMLLQNPLLLIHDIGFQLSFLAVLGLIYIEPILKYCVKFFLNKIFKKEITQKHDNLIMMFSSTIAAQIFTLPVIVYNFGKISFVSPLANILILPAVYYLMFFGFLSAVLGVIFVWLGFIASIIGHILMIYFLFIVDLLSKDWAYKILENVHFVWLIVAYIFISGGTWYLNRKFREKII
jgi:competence protein ComEC